LIDSSTEACPRPIRLGASSPKHLPKSPADASKIPLTPIIHRATAILQVALGNPRIQLRVSSAGCAPLTRSRTARSGAHRAQNLAVVIRSDVWAQELSPCEAGGAIDGVCRMMPAIQNQFASAIRLVMSLRYGLPTITTSLAFASIPDCNASGKRSCSSGWPGVLRRFCACCHNAHSTSAGCDGVAADHTTIRPFRW
jgi:hypothetical protein